jgi:putative RecB family exonuclease
MARANDVYSYSRLSTLDTCARAYEFRYVRKIKEAFTSVESFVGRIVHHTLGWLYSERERSEAPTEAEAVERFDQEWDRRVGSWVKVIRREDSLDARRQIGREMVRRYHRGAFEADRLRTVAIERRLDVDLEGGRRYRGIVDRLAEDGSGALHVIDFKTTARPPAIHGEQNTLQIRSYGLAVLRNHDVEAVDVSYRYLANGSSHELRIDRPGAERVADELVVRIDRAESTTSFPPSPSALCAWCGYRESCDASGFATAGEDDSCPRCDGVLRRREGRFGPFFGCSNFPPCRFTRN